MTEITRMTSVAEIVRACDACTAPRMLVNKEVDRESTSGMGD
jgi:hypothetical protein